MKKMKKILALILSVLFLFAVAVISVSAGTVGNSDDATFYGATVTYSVLLNITSKFGQATGTISYGSGSGFVASQVVIIYTDSDFDIDYGSSGLTSTATEYFSRSISEVQYVDSDHNVNRNGYLTTYSIGVSPN